jgi:predicted nucleic acid-binding Zn ribbon protein
MWNPKNCEYCGVVFQPKTKRTRYCSRKCQNAACRPLIKLNKKTCKCCGIKFKPKRSYQKYCSTSCSDKAARRRKKRALMKQDVKLQLACKRCGNTFYSYSHESQYCGIECYVKDNDLCMVCGQATPDRRNICSPHCMVVLLNRTI